MWAGLPAMASASRERSLEPVSQDQTNPRERGWEVWCNGGCPGGGDPVLTRAKCSIDTPRGRGRGRGGYLLIILLTVDHIVATQHKKRYF